MSKRLKSAIAVFVFEQLDLIFLCVLALAEPLSTHFTHFTHCHRQPISPISLPRRFAARSRCCAARGIVRGISQSESLAASRLGLAALQLDLAAVQLVVLSVGFRSPRELGKFYCVSAIRWRGDHIIGFIAPAIGPNKSKKLTRLIASVHNIRGKV